MKLTSKDYFLFSGGEVHVKLNGVEGGVATITCLDYTMNGFMAVCELKEIISRQGYRPRLVYPYFPYARQDRVMAPNEPFSLKIFADMVNAQNFKEVVIFDPHSDVTPALLNNCRVIPQWEIAKRIIPEEYFTDPNVVWISPDAGAYKKISKLVPSGNIAVGTKVRDKEGKITHTAILSDSNMHILAGGEKCVIVDDICDGGRTFIELAKALDKYSPSDIILYVTHGIFSNGFNELATYINKIYTTDSFSVMPHESFGELVARRPIL